MGAALFLAAAFLLLLPAIRRAFPSAQSPIAVPSPQAETLYEGNEADLYEISISQRWGEAYTLRSQGGCLYLLKNGDLEELDEFLAKRIMSAALILAVEDTVSDDRNEIAGHLQDMGLDPPEITVSIRCLGGREDTLSLGFMVPGAACYYYRWSGSEKIYMCDRGTYDAFTYPAALLLPLRQPELRKGLIDHIAIRLKGQEKLEMAFSTGPTGQKSGTLLAPFTYPMDTAAAENLINAAVDFRLGSLLGPATPESNLQYGLGDPLAVIEIHQAGGIYGGIDETGAFVSFWAGEESFRITIGRKEGEFFYTCEYEGECYLVSGLLVTGFLTATADRLMTWNPADMGDDMISGIQIQWDGRLLDVSQNREEQALWGLQPDWDDASFDVTYTLNGVSISGEAFEGLVKRLKGMRSSGNQAGGFSMDTESPRWQVRITTYAGEIRTLAAYPLNVFFDAVAVNGTVRHELRVGSLEAALGEFRLWE